MNLKPASNKFFVLVIGVALTLFGCRSTPDSSAGYPINNQTNSNPGGAYPVSQPLSTQPASGYPGGALSPVPTSANAGKLVFTLDPIHAGDAHVTGTGPAHLPIRIIDLSRAGAEIGTSLIDDKGRFDIAISPPAVGGYRIGITLGDLTGTKYHIEDFVGGPGYKDYPLIGLVLTSTLAIK